MSAHTSYIGGGRCTLCGNDSEHVRHLPLYVTGSEGCEACHDCCIALTGTAKSIMLAAAKAKKAGYLAALKLAEAKTANTELASGADGKL